MLKRNSSKQLKFQRTPDNLHSCFKRRSNVTFSPIRPLIPRGVSKTPAKWKTGRRKEKLIAESIFSVLYDGIETSHKNVKMK